MTSKQFVALGVRLFCIWLAIYILREVPAYWLAISQQRSTEIAATVVIAIMALYAVIVILLWLFPLTIARKLLPRSAQDQSIALPPHEQIERAGFCLMGLWLLTHAVPGLVFDAVVMHLYHYPGATMELRPQDYAAIAEHLVELALALWLLFGARGLRGLLIWARNVGSTPGRADSSPQE
jgi:hypothetical protein